MFDVEGKFSILIDLFLSKHSNNLIQCLSIVTILYQNFKQKKKKEEKKRMKGEKRRRKGVLISKHRTVEQQYVAH